MSRRIYEGTTRRDRQREAWRIWYQRHKDEYNKKRREAYWVQGSKACSQVIPWRTSDHPDRANSRDSSGSSQSKPRFVGVEEGTCTPISCLQGRCVPIYTTTT
jgi:hypothetical protein